MDYGIMIKWIQSIRIKYESKGNEIVYLKNGI